MDSTVALYDRASISQLEWPDTEYGRYAKGYLLPFVMDGPEQKLIDNVSTTMLIAVVDGVPLPVTVNDSEYENSYVCSPYTHYVTYAREELALLRNRTAETALGGLLAGIGAMLRNAGFNRVVQVNNWLLSTNLFPDIQPRGLKALIAELKRRYPRHGILCRSLNEGTSSHFLAAVAEMGCKLVPSRQIYLLQKPGNAKARWLIKRDKTLIGKAGYEIAGPEDMTAADAPRIKELYDMLYIHKYSPCNPQFSEAFILAAIQSGTLEVHGLRGNGRLDAILGFFVRGGVMTAPLFGYDTALPQETGLYRMLSALLIGIASDRGYLLHESSGVGQFKRNRGAVAELEVTAVCDGHLPLRTRMCWSALEKLLYGIGVPIIRKLKL